MDLVRKHTICRRFALPLRAQACLVASRQPEHSGNEPDIPVIYLLATPTNWQIGNAAYDDSVSHVQAGYVAAFTQGQIIEVELPHYMEAAVPEAIVEYLKAVMAQISD